MASSNKTGKTIDNILFGIFGTIAVILILIVVSFMALIIYRIVAPRIKSNNTTADGFTISSYNVVLDVKEDNKVEVTENINTNWYEPYHHGIYKFTPLWLEYTSKDGRIVKRKAIISNYRAVGDPYSVRTIKKKERIQIGSSNKYVDLGEKEYIIKYTYDMGKDPYKRFDEFIFHVYGDYWGVEINNPSIQVIMPKNIEGYNINFFTDKYRKNNVTAAVDYSVYGNVLYAELNEEKYQKLLENNHEEKNKALMSSLTVDIELPEGYFVGGSWNYGWKSFTISIVTIVSTIIIFCLWLKFGKNYSKRAPTVEFYPPDDLTAAEIGYVYNKNQSSKKFTIALIVQLASKGYIKIDELKSDKKSNLFIKYDDEIQITNLHKKPKPIEDYDLVISRKIEVKKLKEIDENLNKDEKAMMKFLFKSGELKTLNSNINKFLSVKDKLVNNGYIEIVNDNEKAILLDEKIKKSEYEKKLKQYQKDMEEYNKYISLLTDLEKIVYERLFESEDVIIISEHYTLYKAFDEIDKELSSSFENKVHVNISTRLFYVSLFDSILFLILSFISYFSIEDLDPSIYELYYLSFSCGFVSLILALFMKKRTEYGEYITARVKGFREFLMTVEKDKLESLVNENPNYFYNILPYTYALNISKQWIKKFENIPIPEMDMGSFDYGSDRSYSSLYNNVYYAITSSSHGGSSGSSSSGCSSCGGGSSSSGGGCSSCGGGGSW